MLLLCTVSTRERCSLSCLKCLPGCAIILALALYDRFDPEGCIFFLTCKQALAKATSPP
jgi:hypothetical protein